jgi:hypothetical protein
VLGYDFDVGGNNGTVPHPIALEVMESTALAVADF